MWRVGTALTPPHNSSTLEPRLQLAQLQQDTPSLPYTAEDSA